MKRVLLAGLILMLIAGVAFAKEYEVSKKAGAYDVKVTIDRNPPVVGDNNMVIEVRDAAGKQVTDVTVKIDYGMSAMPGMPAMDYKTSAELKGSSYKAKMNLSMSGPWNIVVKLGKAGKTSSMKFTIDAK